MSGYLIPENWGYSYFPSTIQFYELENDYMDQLVLLNQQNLVESLRIELRFEVCKTPVLPLYDDPIKIGASDRN